MNQIVACMNIYNEATTIERAIKSVINFVDRVVVIDGRYPDFPGPQTNSDDGTLELLNKYPKIQVIQCDKPYSQHLKRSMYLNCLFDGDWALIFDGDEELCLRKDVEWVREEIFRHESVTGYYVKEVVDISGTVDWWPIIFRYREGYIYNDDVVLVDRNSKPVLKRPPGTRAVQSAGFYQFQEGMYPLYECYLLHHKFGRPGERLARKFEYWKSQTIARRLKN